MNRLFLYRVYRYNKKLFIFFIAFAGLSVTCNLIGDEITPFYVWGMYSAKEVPRKNYEILQITVNDKIVDYSTGYLPANRFFLQFPLIHYTLMKDGDDPAETFLKEKLKGKFSIIEPLLPWILNSKEEVQEFPSWYKRYLQQTTGEKVQNFKVEMLEASFDLNNHIKINSAYTLIDGR